MLILKGKSIMEKAEERIVELDDVEEPSDADLDEIDEVAIDKMMEELSIDALLEEILYG